VKSSVQETLPHKPIVTPPSLPYIPRRVKKALATTRGTNISDNVDPEKQDMAVTRAFLGLLVGQEQKPFDGSIITSPPRGQGLRRGRT